MDPRVIGRYRIDGVLGEGAMGIVYRGFDEAVARAVAIKVVRKESMAASPAWDAVARFRTEARAAGRLSHPHIVTVYDFAEDADSAHLVCEYVPGRSLDRWLAERGRAEPALALAWMGQLLDALACAHAHGVVHRDVKASNLLVVGNRLLKLADFGIAHVDSADRTQAGLMVGTPSCMAPEQIRGGPIDGRIDVFAAGVLLYQLLTGERPFGGSPQDAMQQILTRDVPPPSRLRPELPAALDEPVLRALAKEPAQRHASAAEFLAALRGAAAAAGLADRAGDAEDATRVVARPDRPAATVAAPAAGAPSPFSPATELAWDPAWLEQVERGLVSHVGPIAALLVRKAGRSARSPGDLVAQVASHIVAPADRSRFLAQWQGAAAVTGSQARTGDAGSRTTAGAGAGPSTGPAAPAAGLDDATVAGIERRLARHMGPLAAVCVRRARRDASSVADLCRRVAGNLADLPARQAFLAECGADPAHEDPRPCGPSHQETSLG
jgi:serine/threonine-protein kinase